VLQTGSPPAAASPRLSWDRLLLQHWSQPASAAPPVTVKEPDKLSLMILAVEVSGLEVLLLMTMNSLALLLLLLHSSKPAPAVDAVKIRQPGSA